MNEMRRRRQQQRLRRRRRRRWRRRGLRHSKDKPQRHCVSVMFLFADHPSLPPHSTQRLSPPGGPPTTVEHQTQPSYSSTARPGNSACDSAGGAGGDRDDSEPSSRVCLTTPRCSRSTFVRTEIELRCLKYGGGLGSDMQPRALQGGWASGLTVTCTE